MNAFDLAYEQVRRTSFRGCDFPSAEQLRSVGLNAEIFTRRFILPAGGLKGMTPEEHSRLMLEPFWTEYPELRPKAKVNDEM